MEMKPVLLVTALLLIVSIGIIMLVLIYQKKQLQYLREKEQLKQHFEKEILESMLEIKEQTFKEVSLELHDNVAQVLTLAKLNLTTIDIDAKGKTIEKVTDAIDLITSSIRDLRDLSKTLNTDLVGELGITKVIEMELAKLEKTGTIKTNFQVHGTPLGIEPKKELILFRIVQEAIHNVIKHSKASVLNICNVYEDGGFTLMINDNGVGFDQKKIKKGSNGLQNIHCRCNLINATCSIQSEPGSGTTFSIHLPV